MNPRSHMIGTCRTGKSTSSRFSHLITTRKFIVILLTYLVMPKVIMSEPCPVGNQLVTSCPARIATKTQSHVPPAPSPQPRVTAVSSRELRRPSVRHPSLPMPLSPRPVCSAICHIKLNLSLLAQALPACSVQGAALKSWNKRSLRAVTDW